MSGRRALLLAWGASIGLTAGILQLVGCSGPDGCATFGIRGTEWCYEMHGAMAWPPGQPELAERIPSDTGDAPVGCLCMAHGWENSAIRHAAAEELAYSHELAAQARNECIALAPEGWETNCLQADGPGAPTFDGVP